MSKKNCKICTHPQKHQINTQLKNSVPLRKICSAYPGITLSSLQRHKQAHIKEPGNPALSGTNSALSDMLVAVEALLRKAEQDNDKRNTLALLKEKRLFTAISKIVEDPQKVKELMDIIKAQDEY